MHERLRILPALALALTGLLAIKLAELAFGFDAVPPALAGAPAGKPSTEHGATKDHAEAKPGDHVAAKEIPAMLPDDPHTEYEAGGASHGEDGASRDGAHGKAAKANRIPGDSEVVSASELDVLESLTRRREALDQRALELDMKENLLSAAEQRIDTKIAELKSIEAEIKSALDTLSAQEEEQIKSLVKVYESMKPKDAAQIFENLERRILIRVIGRMKEAKMAAVLAQMDPKKAQELTVLLATKTEIPGRT